MVGLHGVRASGYRLSIRIEDKEAPFIRQVTVALRTKTSLETISIREVIGSKGLADIPWSAELVTEQNSGEVGILSGCSVNQETDYKEDVAKVPALTVKSGGTLSVQKVLKDRAFRRLGLFFTTHV